LAASFFGILLALIAIWSLWRARVRPGWFMPTIAAALVVGTVGSLANTPITKVRRKRHGRPLRTDSGL
jgi:hypothetical protein